MSPVQYSTVQQVLSYPQSLTWRVPAWWITNNLYLCQFSGCSWLTISLGSWLCKVKTCRWTIVYRLEDFLCGSSRSFLTQHILCPLAMQAALPWTLSHTELDTHANGRAKHLPPEPRYKQGQGNQCRTPGVKFEE